MLVIRFSRTGKKKQPYYRIIISEKHKDPWGNYLELLGNYNPRTKKAELKTDRIKYWISVGAQPSNTVHNLLVKQGIIEGDKKKSVKISKKRRNAKAQKGEREDAKGAKNGDAKTQKEQTKEGPKEKVKPEVKEEPKIEKKSDKPIKEGNAKAQKGERDDAKAQNTKKR